MTTQTEIRDPLSKVQKGDTKQVITCESLEAVHSEVVCLKHLNARTSWFWTQLAGQGIQRVEHGCLPQGTRGYKIP